MRINYLNDWSRKPLINIEILICVQKLGAKSKQKIQHYKNSRLRQRVLKISLNKNERKFTLLTTAILTLFLMAGLASAASVTINSPQSSQNVSNTITLNVTVAGMPNTTNVTYSWINASGSVSSTNNITNTTANQSEFTASYDTTTISDGYYNVTFNASNSTNSSASTATGILVDNTAPNVTMITQSGNATSSSLNVTFRANDNYAQILNCSLYANSTLEATNASVSDGTNTTLTATGLSAGSYAMYVTCLDEANNAANSSNITVQVPDVTAPAVTINTPTAAQVFTSQGNITFNATVSDSGAGVDSVIFKVTGTHSYTFSGNNTSSASNYVAAYNFTSDGQYTVTVWANDTAGNLNNSVSRNFTVDANAPSITFDTPGSGNVLKGENFTFKATVTDTGSSVSSVTMNITNTDVGTLNVSSPANSGNDYSFSNNTADWPEGTHILIVNAKDANGNSISKNITFTTDKTAPSIPSLTCGNIFTGQNIQCTCEAIDNGTSVTRSTSGTESGLTFSIIGSNSIGNQAGTCTVTDRAGNSASKSAPYTVTSSYQVGNSQGSPNGNSQPASEAKVWALAYKGEKVQFNITHVFNLSFSKVEFTLNKNASSLEVRLYRRNVLPSGYTNFTKTIYRIIEFRNYNIDANIEGNATLEFDVLKTWFTEHALSPKDISLYHYNNGTWDEKPTKLVNVSGNYYVFSAPTENFSYFIIGQNSASKESSQPAANTANATAENNTSAGAAEGNNTASAGNNASANNTKNAESQKQAPKQKSGPGALFWVLFILAIIAVIFAFFYYRWRANGSEGLFFDQFKGGYDTEMKSDSSKKSAKEEPKKDSKPKQKSGPKKKSNEKKTAINDKSGRLRSLR